MQLILVCVGVMIYLPFVKMIDRQYLSEEKAATEDEDDDISLDDLSFDDIE